MCGTIPRPAAPPVRRHLSSTQRATRESGLSARARSSPVDGLGPDRIVYVGSAKQDAGASAPDRLAGSTAGTGGSRQSSAPERARDSVNDLSPSRLTSVARAKEDVSTNIVELYRLPRDEFTGARNQLVKRLRRDGKRAEAEQVKAVRKPTAAAWIVNQLRQHARGDLRKLLSAGERMRKARTAPELRKASAAEREAIAGLLGRVEEVAGSQPVATIERVRETLHAAAADPSVGELVSAGRLDKEQRLVGFAGAALTTDDRVEKHESREVAAGNAREAAQSRAEQRRLRRERDAAKRELEQAKRGHERALADAQHAQTELERAERRLHKAREREQELP
jgi:hypothetical protein